MTKEKQKKLECGPMPKVMAALGQEPLKMYIWCASAGDGQTSCKVWLASVERRRCSKSQIPLRYLLADRSEAGRRPVASWNLAYHLAR